MTKSESPTVDRSTPSGPERTTVDRAGALSSDPSNRVAVRTQGLDVRFHTGRSDVVALQDINLQINRGEFVSLLGPSGCGKSTLLRIISDLVQPTAGSISVLGGSPALARRQRRFGFVFQDAALLPWRSALKNVELPLEFRKPGGHPGEQLSARDALELVGLAGREESYPHQLSGGMRQRVSIARALVSRPEILLMDEPFGALDEITRDRLNEELRRIWQQTGITIVFVTHSIAEAAFLSERVVVMSASPGSVHAEVDVPLGGQRDRSVRETPEFGRLITELRRLLEGRGQSTAAH
jgi:NitT/TauT family transport system ATP-binding protein